MNKENLKALMFLVVVAGLFSLANAILNGLRQQQASTPVPVTVEYGAGARPGVSGVYFSTAPAMVWRVTDTAGEMYTYPESAGWGCVSGGSEGGAFRVECRRMTDGREAERVELVAVRLEHVAAGEGAE